MLLNDRRNLLESMSEPSHGEEWNERMFRKLIEIGFELFFFCFGENVEFLCAVVEWGWVG